MIKSLKYKFDFSNGQSRSNEAAFEPGSTLITGKNGRGKSLNLECIGFCLFGSDALRGKTEDYKRIKAELCIAIKGVEYVIKRTKSGAEVFLGEKKIVSGNKPVNTWAVETLGFDFKVFCISQWCKQGDIQALAEMKPTERKQMVDSVTGMTQLDALAKGLGEQINALNAEIKAANQFLVKPVEPNKPESDLTILEQGLEYFEGELADFRRLSTEVNGFRQPIEPLAPSQPIAPTAPEKPQYIAPRLEEVREVIIPQQFQGYDLKQTMNELHERLLTIKSSRNKFEVLTQKRASIDTSLFTGINEEQLKQQHHNYGIAQQIKALHEQGQTTCPHCKNSHPIASDAIAKLPQVDLAILNNPPISWDDFNKEREYQSLELQLNELQKEVSQHDVVAQLHSTVTDLWQEIEKNEHNRVQNQRLEEQAKQNYDGALTSWAKTVEAQEAQYQAALNKFDQDVTAFEQAKIKYQEEIKYQEDKLALLKKYGPNHESDLQAELNNVRQGLNDWEVYNQQYQTYTQQKASYDASVESLNQTIAQCEDMKNARKALTELKARVKSYILPSLNKVASFLLNEMTGGEHVNVNVSDDFEVEVDGQPLRTLSGSGKDITNLAIRIGLGRIITHSVLPMMMLDEIDSAMDDDRASFTWQCIQKITPQIGQVLQVSHKSLPSQHTITVN